MGTVQSCTRLCGRPAQGLASGKALGRLRIGQPCGHCLKLWPDGISAQADRAQHWRQVWKAPLLQSRRPGKCMWPGRRSGGQPGATREGLATQLGIRGRQGCACCGQAFLRRAARAARRSAWRCGRRAGSAPACPAASASRSLPPCLHIPSASTPTTPAVHQPPQCVLHQALHAAGSQLKHSCPLCCALNW